MADADPGELTLLAAEAAKAERKQKMAETRRKLLGGFAIGSLLLGAGYFGWHALGASSVSTDNAYVSADAAQVTPLVAGPVAKVHVVDTQMVKRGDILLELDSSDAVIALAEAEADLRLARQKYAQSFATGQALSAQVQARGAQVVKADAQLIAAQAALAKARVDLDRREKLAPSGAVSGDELTSARNDFAAAQADYAVAKAAIAQAGSDRGTALGDLAANQATIGDGPIDDNPQVASARARVQQAKLNLARTIIRSPVDGVVTSRKVQVGQQVTPGASLMLIVPVSQVYVNANFKESQLRNVRPGQSVKLVSDLYGSDVEYDGRVVGFSGGTGSAFSLIPAQNATGNWIKVVQRVPVRIAIDPRQLASHPLRVGLSMEAEVDTSTAD